MERSSKNAKKYEAPVRKGAKLDRVAFPLGGIGAGMMSMEGTGAISQMSLRNKPDVYNEPFVMFGALYVKGANTARVIEGPVPMWKAFGQERAGSGNGLHGRSYGLPRFAKASFSSLFPFAKVALSDPELPVEAEIMGWSPFTPGNADDSSLPVAALEYKLTNSSGKTVKGVFSYHVSNFLLIDNSARVETTEDGLALSQPAIEKNPESEASFAVGTDDPAAHVDAAWFRGGWFDPLTFLWKHIAAGDVVENPTHAEGKSGTGGSIYIPFTLKAGESKTIRIRFAWYVPRSSLNFGCAENASGSDCGCEKKHHRPWYSSRFANLAEAAEYWRVNYARLCAQSKKFSDCFHDTTLPTEVVESVAANLSILKSPTCLRQADGRFWAYEGCSNAGGCCHGSCTHVWNYAQALPHLFPELERSMRETEFQESQDQRGHQTFRSSLPIGPVEHNAHAASDGQLGGIMKLYREWRISGDTEWMRSMWPEAKRSLEYCVETWDPDHTGTLVEPHHNTYDIEFWGPDGMCTSFYLGALVAATEMARTCGDDPALYEKLYAAGRKVMDTALWNGGWYIQDVRWEGLRAPDPLKFKALAGIDSGYSTEAVEILRREGPKYQYGAGCISDGVLGDWIARCSGLGPVLDEHKTAKHLKSVFKHNFRESLRDHANPQRPGYAFPQEGGLLLCSWPNGGKPSLPFVYSDEVWTGIEYQVASHLAMTGQIEDALAIVHAVRVRYDGTWRNPFDEYECGHWYARAMASYGLLQAFSGARYDAVEKTLYINPPISGDFRAFICTATGYGTVGVKDGKPFLEVASGEIAVKEIKRIRGLGARG